MLNENHNLVNLSQSSIGDVSEININSESLPKRTCDKICREFFFSSNRNTKSLNKSFHQSKGAVPLTMFHQDVRRLRGKTNELLSQIYSSSLHVLCLSEHLMNYI
jgi:hypothetical protein